MTAALFILATFGFAAVVWFLVAWLAISPDDMEGY